MTLKIATWVTALWLIAIPNAHGAPAAFEILNDDGHRFTLLGSIHLLRPSHELPDTVHRLYDRAETLAMELDLDDLEPAIIGAQMLAAGQLPPGETLQDHLDPSILDQTRAALDGFGVPIEVLGTLEPWLLALTLMQFKLAQLGFDPNHGLEQRLLRFAQRDGKEVTGLEEITDQIDLFDSLGRDEQANMLAETLHEMEAMEEEMAVLVDAWFEGDLPALTELLPQSFEDHPELYEGLVVNRNRMFAARIQDMLAAQNNVLVVVGVLHLVGDSSVVEFLRERGLTVKRLQ